MNAITKTKTSSTDNVDSELTMNVKSFATKELFADLVGVANIERYEHAPIRMSPQGIMPTAKSVVMMAVHHPDACIELGGLKHPQEIGPYAIQYHMNNRLDEMSYRMALHLERQGFRAVPIVSSNIWRYKGYKELTEQFAPDVSHMHSAVAAGLAEFGYNGLAISPEYGARQRWVTVITDAVLTRSPLLEPGSVCDNCMLCARHCMSGALTKELDGWNVIKIEDKEYKYVKKNLWRCSWGEHFDLDLDLEIPDVVNEEVIYDALKEHGIRGGEMGSCLRYCLPKARRYFDKSYTNAPRRKRDTKPIDADLHRGVFETARGIAADHGAEFVVVPSQDWLDEQNIDLKDFLPDAQSAMTIGLFHDARPNSNQLSVQQTGATLNQVWEFIVHQSAYDIARLLERQGHSAVVTTKFPNAKINAALGENVRTHTVITSARLPATGLSVPKPQATALISRARLKDLLQRKYDVDAMGVASAALLGDTVESLKPVFDGEDVFMIKEKGVRFLKYEAEVNTVQRRVLRPEDHIPGAKSVIVLGLRIPAETVACTARPPAEAVGPYAFAQYQNARQLGKAAWHTARILRQAGYKAALTFDLTNTTTVLGTPRGTQPDGFSNRFAAVAAGLGRLGKGGFLINPEFGANLRFVAVVTDAKFECDKPLSDDAKPVLCDGCSKCVDSCLTCAFKQEASVKVNGSVETFQRIDGGRCDWAKRFPLTAEEGNEFIGWHYTVEPPEEITTDALAEALKGVNPLAKARPCHFERCILACPYARES